MIDVDQFTFQLNKCLYDPETIRAPGQTLAERLVSCFYGINCLGEPGDQDKALTAYGQSKWAK